MATAVPNETPLILLTGATGYVGGRLLHSLQALGYRVRCFVSNPEVLKETTRRTTEVVTGDALDRASLASAMREVNVAYYLVHSMGSSGAFEESDRLAALNFAQSARAAGV